MRTSPRSARGVTLIEGLISTVILLIGMVGVLQGLAVASVQNSMANRHTRASIIAQELMGSIEQLGRARMLGPVGVPVGSGLFVAPQCSGGVPVGVADFMGELVPLPASLATFTTNCYIDFDALPLSFLSLTPGYTAQDNVTYQRVIAVYQDPSVLTNPDNVIHVGVNVGWRDGGRVRIVKRFTALYDTATNQTNLEF